MSYQTELLLFCKNEIVEIKHRICSASNLHIHIYECGALDSYSEHCLTFKFISTALIEQL